MRIFAGVPWKPGVKRQWCCRKRQFLVLSLAISSEILQVTPTLLYSIIHSIVAFPLTPKYMTLHDLELPFYVKFCFWQVQDLLIY